MTPSRRLVLVCNSHIDPVWLWPWEEGLAATLATFRSAAALCEDTDGFVFCHNEALLYEWVEQHEPALFERIGRLVRAGRWHVMGGWYLQPDCNLPSGESFVRQILVGRQYFADRFGVAPQVAVNLDPFGHSRGLVQILARSGYTGYLFCRPDRRFLDLPAPDFVWVGYDGSTLLAHRADAHYNSAGGHARAKVEAWLTTHPDDPDGLLLWGVGNHGGGPSRQDLADLAALMADEPGRGVTHGTPEDYFARLGRHAAELPRVDTDLNPWAPGCYTSMMTVKRAHRRLEARLFGAERMLAHATVTGLMPWPAAGLRDALRDLLFCQFHDILPGSCVAEVEAQALQRLGHGLDIVDRLRARAFFALLGGERPAAADEYPVFVYNPHPFAVTGCVTCELQPPEPNTDPAVFLQPVVTDADGTVLASQLEKESCNIQADQRKRLVWHATLPPATMSRFPVRIRAASRDAAAPDRPPAGPPPVPALLRHRGDCHVDIDPATGLVARYRVGGIDYLQPGAFCARTVRDSADPWGMKVRAFRDPAGEFRLMSPSAAAQWAGVGAAALAPVRIIEDGPVRTVVEALFDGPHAAAGAAPLRPPRSAIVLRYELPRAGTGFGLVARVTWLERDTMLKLCVPTAFPGMRVLGQAPYGVEACTREAEELVAHDWLACVSADSAHALTVITDTTRGFDYADGELRLSCLRAPAYAGHPVDDVTPVVRQDRFEQRIDQGVHEFRFWIDAGPARARLEAVDREAAVRLDPPMALNAFPSGLGQRAAAGPSLSDGVIQLAALKISEDGRALIVRLFEPAGAARSTTVSVPALDLQVEVTLGPFELRTLAIDLETHVVTTVDLLERPLAP